MKDSEDDCDLDPQLYVSDLLLDEGKATRDGDDQRVTIKVILEQGRATREGSVAVGHMLVDPRFQSQLQKTSRPPVPKFPNVLSSLGKRSQNREDSETTTAKRPRQFEHLRTLRDESLVSSIEQDPHAPSDDVVLATQPSLPQDGTDWQNLARKVKIESPEYWRSWQEMPDPSIDELEQLEEQPTGFRSRQRSHRQTSKTQHYPEPNGLDHQPIQGPVDERLRLSQAPHTPHMEPPHHLTNASRLPVSTKRNPDPSPRQQSSASASKFKKAMRRDVYDYPESDIDDSQMSPRSRMATRHHQASVDRLSLIENQRSPGPGDDPARRLSITEAMDLLDNGSVFDDNGFPGSTLQSTRPLLNGNNPASHGLASDTIYEDTEQNIVPMNITNGHLEDANDTDLPDDAGDDQEKENRPVRSPMVELTSKPLPSRHPTSPLPLEPAAMAPSSNTPSDKKRKRARRQAPKSVNPDGDDKAKSRDEEIAIGGSQKPSKSARRESANDGDTPSLDSPGEQLSLSLQESARKSASVDALKKKLETQQQLPSSPLANATHNKSHGGSTSKETATSTKKAAKDNASGNTTSIKSPKRQRKNRKSDVNGDPPTINVERVEGTPAPSSPISKPLPKSGSASTTVEKTNPPVSDQRQSLTVENRSDSRKSPSVALGLTEEEIKIMESRAGMTQEQYDAEKKKRQLEAKHYAAEQKKKELGAMSLVAEQEKNAARSRRESSGKQSASKLDMSKNGTPTAAASSGKPSASRTSPSIDNEVVSVKGKKPAGDVASTSAKSTISTKKAPSMKTDTAKTPPKTPSKTSTKTPSVKSATTSKESTKAPATSKTESKDLNISNSKKTATKSAPQPNPAISSSNNTKAKATKAPVATIRGAKSLKDLRQVMKSAQEPLNIVTTTTSRASSILPYNKRSALNSASDDDSDDAESSSDDESEDDNVRSKKYQQQQRTEKKTTTGARNGQAVQARDVAKRQPVTPAAKDKAATGTSSSDSSDDSDEDEYERKQTEAARSRKLADAARAKTAPSRVGPSSMTGIARPDPSIRDASVDPTSSDDDDDDEEL